MCLNEGHIYMEMRERNQIIYEMRESGSKYTEIAKLFDIGKGRVRDIYLKDKMKREIGRAHV